MFGADDLITEDGVRVGDFVGDFALTGTAVRAVDGFDVDDFEGIRGDCDLLGFAVFALGLAFGLLDEGARVGTLVGFEGDVVVGGTDLV